MSGMLERLGAAFVGPAAPAAPAEDRPDVAPVAVPAPAVGVLCRPEDRWAAGGAVGLGLAGRGGATLVAVWTGEPPALPAWGAPGTFAARRLAHRLERRGHRTRAAGRLVLVALEADPVAAAAEVLRACAATDGATVLVVAGPRDAVLGSLLTDRDRIIAVRREGDEDAAAIARLAVASLSGAGHRADELMLPPGAGARVAIAAGFACVGVARRLAATVEGPPR